MTDPELARLINAGTFALVVLLLGAWFARMFYRLGVYVFIVHARPDIILIRDLAVVGSFGFAFALALLFRVLGISVVDNAGFALLTGAPIVAALSLAVWIEYRLVDRNGNT